jgi:DNA repair photolyase
MKIKETAAKSILRKRKKIDSWFISHYGMNLYRGCYHNCIYCDGRAEKYQVDGNFGEEVVVKTNAIEILDRELNPNRKRIPFKKSYFMIGGGVGDSYQPVEKKFQLTRKVLELMLKYNYPVHVLTKSLMVQRDIDLLEKINERSRAIVSFSFSSIDEKACSIFEPKVASPQRRLDLIRKLKDKGIPCGLFLMPVIPYVTDSKEMMEETINQTIEAGVDFIIFSGMTLKQGRQRDYFIKKLDYYYPSLSKNYAKLYSNDKWGNASQKYYLKISQDFSQIAKKYRIAKRIPPKFFRDILSVDDFIIVMLEQIDYLSKMEGKPSPYGFAAYSLNRLERPISEMRNQLKKIKGVETRTEKVILELLDYGESSLYDDLSGCD